MKIRQGFVSNSSSSSFIIAVAKLKDGKEDIFKPYENEGAKVWKFNKTELFKNLPFGASINRENLTNQAYTNDSQEVSLKFDPKETYLIVNVGNDEGDCSFESFDEYELDWHKAKDPSYFVGKQREIIDLLSDKENFKECDWQIGASRNG